MPRCFGGKQNRVRGETSRRTLAGSRNCGIGHSGQPRGLEYRNCSNFSCNTSKTPHTWHPLSFEKPNVPRQDFKSRQNIYRATLCLFAFGGIADFIFTARLQKNRNAISIRMFSVCLCIYTLWFLSNSSDLTLGGIITDKFEVFGINIGTYKNSQFVFEECQDFATLIDPIRAFVLLFIIRLY